MKRAVFVLVMFFALSSSVQALSWAYGFVVLDGKVYEVLPEVIVAEGEVGKVIGKVKTEPNDMTGSYYGNASNYYPIGTKYAEIEGVNITEAIAVEEDGYWVKAVYSHDAMFHIMNILTSPWVIGAIVFVLLLLAMFMKKSLNNRAGF